MSVLEGVILWNLESDIDGVFSSSVRASRRIVSYDHGSSVSLLRITFPEILRTSDLVEINKVPPSLLVRRLVFLRRRDFSGVS